MGKIWGLIHNLRPYSWIDVVLVGLAAKFSVSGYLEFSEFDLLMAIGLLSQWFFFNLLLEWKHNYSYRENVRFYYSFPFLLPSLAIGFIANPLSIIFCVLASIFSFFYILKKTIPITGFLSFIFRGFIQSFYFLFALALYQGSILTSNSIVIAATIFLIYAARAIVGDMRDIKHDAQRDKSTVPVVFGFEKAGYFSIALLSLAAVLVSFSFGSVLPAIPLIMFAVLLFFYSNGYVLHQLSIFKTSFFHAALISFFTHEGTILVLLLFCGVFLNSVFYHELERESNPKFVGD